MLTFPSVQDLELHQSLCIRPVYVFNPPIITLNDFQKPFFEVNETLIRIFIRNYE